VSDDVVDSGAEVSWLPEDVVLPDVTT